MKQLIILAQQPTQLSDQNFNLEGWMLIGAGIAICLAIILLFFFNKLFTKRCLEVPKGQKAEKVSKLQAAGKAEKARQHKAAGEAEKARKLQEAREAEKARKLQEAREAEKARKLQEAEEAERIRKLKEAQEAERARRLQEAEEAERIRQLQAAKKATYTQPESEKVVAHGAAKDMGAQMPGGTWINLIDENDLSKSISFYLKNELIVGRNPQKSQVIIADDPTVSSKHCKFYVFDDKVYLMDLGSTNGTFVNGKLIEYAVCLKVGDKIAIGARKYLVEW